MNNIDEIIEIFNAIDFEPHAIFHCISNYPTPENWHIERITDFISKFSNKINIGLSDHSGSILPSILAYQIGANYFEFHLSINKNYGFGPIILFT